MLPSFLLSFGAGYMVTFTKDLQMLGPSRMPVLYDELLWRLALVTSVATLTVITQQHGTAHAAQTTRFNLNLPFY